MPSDNIMSVSQRRWDRKNPSLACPPIGNSVINCQNMMDMPVEQRGNPGNEVLWKLPHAGESPFNYPPVK